MTPRFVPAVPPPRYPFGRARARIRTLITRLVTGAGLATATMLAVMLLDAAQHAYDRHHTYSKHEVTQLIVKKLAWEAFPQWAAARPDRACPRTLGELNPWMDRQETVDRYADSWNHALRFTCEAGPPVRFVVWSVGEDGVDGTADDIRSDE